MRKIEKETLQIINEYKCEEYNKLVKMIDIRENQLRDKLEEELEIFCNKSNIKDRIEIFKAKYGGNVAVDFCLNIRAYYTNYNLLFEDDEFIKNAKQKIKEIENERNKMKLILQNSDIKSLEYKQIISKLKKGDNYKYGC